jgi:uncharacterized membrane protein
VSRLLKDLDELLSQGVITPDVAERIKKHYEKPASGVSRMVIAFGIIGALLVGMGVVLILAHNWDIFPKAVKLLFGLGPLALCQVLVGVLLYRNSQSTAWREAAAVLLIFSVATAIAIVTQTYNISTGEIDNFLLTWMIVSIPVAYLIRSHIASLLCWICITWYGFLVGFGISDTSAPLTYWALALACLPYYVMLVRRTPDANAAGIHAWVIALSFTMMLGATNFESEDILIPAYATLFSCFMLIGQLPAFANRKLLSNGWLVVGSGAMICLLLFLTFEWPDFSGHGLEWWLSPEFTIWIGLFAAASYLLHEVANHIGYSNILSKSYTFIVFIPLMFIGMYSEGSAMIVTNILILALGVYTIREGALANRLWQMNYGMLILSVLIMCRFFDSDIPFVFRGLLFIAIGAGFFATNYYMMRKRKAAKA